MERGEMAGTYLRQYEDTDITIEYVEEFELEGFDWVVLFGTSDGRHWFSDNAETVEVKYRAESVDWDDNNGWGRYLINGKPEPYDKDEQDYWV